MSKTSQRSRQAYEEGHRDAKNRNGVRYLRHPFMDAYRAGYQDGLAMAKPRTVLQWFREVFA
ncbi:MULTISPECIES: hypothetical protein [Pseudomonas]|uniref:hypothetical protein n=1 Tax=Pseudomonas TaxID=286 RepID=UPI000B154B5D|nr:MULTISPECIES: hypothetical protein [Pseudomonas]MBJ2303870.1 hypothetical protein [Pseudomonas sp. MF2846]MBK3492265.1 hypothetical protein [Pseudomonas sp. MF2857]